MSSQDGTKSGEQDTVDLWQFHPRHKPVTQYHTLMKADRRLPENAQIRRWVDLADRVLASDKPQPEPEKTFSRRVRRRSLIEGQETN
ncbi:MAG TPA: hypothetical protein VG498_03995 [Terriglobales bacterium]|nr:hypothetical protein [Terriglobales bacterium]